ncbi:MAG: DUF1819 family protein [Schwartzia succinivorans]|jgi:hypothetical protein|uniref:DUF1819 family protein n=1 Tax=Schwartzia succinivorans TaxID=55507 RepID=UPI002357DD9B|nr:DUF1819 family protein [Schwartzia succinivorans]MBE6098024.1 DUF1819 family protein [Schwartzia succinivorans]
MRRQQYSAGAVKVAFWFQEFRTLIELLSEGKTYEEIKALNEQDNIFGASTVTRKRQIYSTVSARAKAMDESFVHLFMCVNATAQKQLALAAVMAQDTLFYEFVYEVIHEKLVLCTYELTDADMEKFFRRKQVQDERVAAWTDATFNRLRRTYREILTGAGILEKKNKGPRHIYAPLFDLSVEKWLQEHDMAEVVYALSDR